MMTGATNGRHLLPDREHVQIWRRVTRRMTVEALKAWHNEVLATKIAAPDEVDDPTDTIIICNAMMMAINEELRVRKGRP